MKSLLIRHEWGFKQKQKNLTLNILSKNDIADVVIRGIKEPEFKHNIKKYPLYQLIYLSVKFISLRWAISFTNMQIVFFIGLSCPYFVALYIQLCEVISIY